MEELVMVVVKAVMEEELMKPVSQEYASPRITRQAGLVVLGYEVPHCPLLTSLPVAGGIGKPNKLSFAHKQQICTCM